MEKILINNNEFTLMGKYEYKGKLTVWGREVFVFVDDFKDVEDLVAFVKKKINWVNDNKALILDSFMIENEHYVDVVNEAIEKRKFKEESKITYEDFMGALFVNSITLYCSDSSIVLDLQAENDYLFGHLATMEIDGDYHIEFSGLNG